MKERKADVILATVLALTFAAFAAGGALYLRTLDSLGLQLEEKVGTDAYIDLGEPERAEAHGLLYHQVLSAAGAVGDLLTVAVVLCLCVEPVCAWVLPIHRRNMKSNPPRAPAVAC